jgi:hypothetical protein
MALGVLRNRASDTADEALPVKDRSAGTSASAADREPSLLRRATTILWLPMLGYFTFDPERKRDALIGIKNACYPHT